MERQMMLNNIYIVLYQNKYTIIQNKLYVYLII